MRAGLFITCVDDALYPETPEAVVRILERLGREVDFPADQTCCGQMHANPGHRDDAARLARAIAPVPDRHVVAVPRDQIVGRLAEAPPRLEPTAPQTWIFDPSATSDIELQRVEGVHGPRRLDAALLDT